MEAEPRPPQDDPLHHEYTSAEVIELVDRLYEASDKAAFLIMGQMVERIRHDPYSPLGDPRSIATGDDW